MRLLLSLALFAPAALASDLVGPASCRTCHAEAYKIWSTSSHARATASLTTEQRKAPLCLQCHSRDEARAGQAEVSGVSCETCHGSGRWYQAAPVMRDKELAHAFGLADPTPQSCMVCHGGETPSLRKFDVKEAMGRIDHWTADRAARRKPSSSAAWPPPSLEAWPPPSLEPRSPPALKPRPPPSLEARSPPALKPRSPPALKPRPPPALKARPSPPMKAPPLPVPTQLAAWLQGRS